MKASRKTIAIGAMCAALGSLGGGYALADSGGGNGGGGKASANTEQADEHGEDGDEGEAPDVALTGSTLAKASDAALAKVGDGKVTGSEHGDDGEAAYEIEVTHDDGTTTDVELDSNFKVTATEDEGPEGQDDADEQGSAEDPAD
ncbi:MAG: uncharacterized protein JWM90_1186 [Thermoleophilia bacterium]|nr:uncharacterized protein [Thermoleophilia bacterium]